MAAALRTPLALVVFVLAAPPLAAQAPATDTVPVGEAVAAYNRAMVGQDLAALKALLAPEVVLFEHSVRNVGLDDVWENHLRPEVQELKNAQVEFNDVRISRSGDLALVLRQYRIRATMEGRPIDARGNETMVWVRRDGRWLVSHIHYSHACPRPAPGEE